MIDLSPHYLQIILQLIQQHLPQADVWAFGSRVTWTAKDYSDLDLVLKAQQPLPPKRFFQFQEALDESDLPIKVDVLDWHQISTAFRENIKKRYEVIYTPKQKDKDSVMMSKFDKLSDIAEVVMGQSPNGKDVNDVNDGFPLLNGPTEFTTRNPIPVQYTTEGRKFSKTGDILFCVRGSTTGKMNYADQKYAIGRGIAAIRGKNGYPTPYVKAVIERNLSRLLLATTGSTFPNVGRDLLLNFEVETVSPKETIIINEIIVSLEDKNELNRQTNQTLEQIAQAIFKSWFVNFEPVKAKIAAKPTKRSNRLPKPFLKTGLSILNRCMPNATAKPRSGWMPKPPAFSQMRLKIQNWERFRRGGELSRWVNILTLNEEVHRDL